MQHNDKRNQPSSNFITRKITYANNTKTVSLKNPISKDAMHIIIDLDNTVVADNITNILRDFLRDKLVELALDAKKKLVLTSNKELARATEKELEDLVLTEEEFDHIEYEGLKDCRGLAKNYMNEMWELVKNIPLHGLPEFILPHINSILNDGNMISFYSSTDYLDIYMRILKERVGLNKCDFLKFDVISWNADRTPKEFTFEIDQNPKNPNQNLIMTVIGFPYRKDSKNDNEEVDKEAHIAILEILAKQIGFIVKNPPVNEMVCDDNSDECSSAVAKGMAIVPVKLYSKNAKKEHGAHFQEMAKFSKERREIIAKNSSSTTSSRLVADEKQSISSSSSAVVNHCLTTTNNKKRKERDSSSSISKDNDILMSEPKGESENQKELSHSNTTSEPADPRQTKRARMQQ